MHFVSELPPAREHDDGDVPQEQVLFQSRADLQAVHPRHVAVQDDEIRPFVVHERQRGLPVCRFDDLESARLKDRPEDVAQVRVVVRHQNGLRGWGDHEGLVLAGSSGRVKVNVVPWPSVDSTQIFP